jgi:hypothetical protein
MEDENFEECGKYRQGLGAKKTRERRHLEEIGVGEIVLMELEDLGLDTPGLG